jgi:hypothetical protein
MAQSKNPLRSLIPISSCTCVCESDVGISGKKYLAIVLLSSFSAQFYFNSGFSPVNNKI